MFLRYSLFPFSSPSDICRHDLAAFSLLALTLPFASTAVVITSMPSISGAACSTKKRSDAQAPMSIGLVKQNMFRQHTRCQPVHAMTFCLL
jgi:hypothetical protein